jgi:hypothetical protein
MDDLKLYATDKNQLLSLLETTAIFSTNIQMSFGIEKCATPEAKKGKIVASENLNLNLTPLTIPTLETDKIYKYLGIQQLLTQSKDKIKQSLTKSYFYRLKLILSSSLNATNKIKSINSWSTPILMYSFGIIGWSNTELQSLNRVMGHDDRIQDTSSKISYRAHLSNKKTRW